MKLLDLMLAHNVQWPEGYDYASQDAGDTKFPCGRVYFYPKNKPTIKGTSTVWENPSGKACKYEQLPELADDWPSVIICKADYIAAQHRRLALKEPVLAAAPEHPDVFAFKKWYAETLPVVEATAAGAEVEYKSFARWETKHGVIFNTGVQYRIKPQPPKTININGYEVPEPLRCYPPKGTYLYSVASAGAFSKTQWDDSIVCRRLLVRGMLHTTKEAAEIHSKALASFTTLEV